MIYLVDDKRIRQEKDYSWNEALFNKYSQVIRPIYTLYELENNRKDIFKSNNIILYHESFLDKTSLKSEALIKRSDLDEFSKKKDTLLAFFSGSKNSRVIEKNVAHLPVSILYQNLEIFIQKYAQGDLQLNYLLFGENPYIEKTLLSKLENDLHHTEEEPSAKIYSSKNLFFRPAKKSISNAIENADEVILFNKVSDEKLSEKIKEELNVEKYDNIFIPLCFGETLSDYNGLRLAAHIRCTETPNRLSNIFIYSFVEIEYLMKSKYFDILKTKNVRLVGFSKKDFEESANGVNKSLTKNELPYEIAKLKLEPPKNYEDNHSIANEWAIYRWANAVNANDSDISKVILKINNNLYFKYLQTIYPVSQIPKITSDSLIIDNIKSSKLLYIDDEANKGWYEIFCTILADYNKVEDFEYLCDEFIDKSIEEIINITIKKIKDQDTDIVILDFRIHKQDFITKEVGNITGIQLLKKIKEFNPGIQVIIFSATNKVWNFQALQKAGADGFVVKESPENSINPGFTNQTVTSFIEQLNKSVKRYFLKESFITLAEIKKNLIYSEYIDDTDYHHFIKTLIKQVDLIVESLKRIEINAKSSLDIVFLNCFNFLEQFKNDYYLKYIDNRYVLGINEIEMNRYSPTNDGILNNGLFIPNNSNDKPSWFNTLTAIAIDYFEACNLNDDLVKNLNRIKNKRNNFIHNTKPHFNKNELKSIINIMMIFSKKMKE